MCSPHVCSFGGVVSSKRCVRASSGASCRVRCAASCSKRRVRTSRGRFLLEPLRVFRPRAVMIKAPRDLERRKGRREREGRVKEGCAGTYLPSVSRACFLCRRVGLVVSDLSDSGGSDWQRSSPSSAVSPGKSRQGSPRSGQGSIIGTKNPLGICFGFSNDGNGLLSSYNLDGLSARCSAEQTHITRSVHLWSWRWRKVSARIAARIGSLVFPASQEAFTVQLSTMAVMCRP